MHPILEKSVAALYVAFTAKHPRKVQGCPCCTRPEALEKLAWHGRPRQEIQAKDLDFYARKAMTTVGSADDFRYFLPRVFELCLEGKLETDAEVIFGKLTCGNWRGWPQKEQTALIDLGDAISRWWMVADTQSQTNAWQPTSTWACCLGQYLDDLTPHLDRLLAPTPEAEKNLIAFYEDNAYLASQGKMGAFWEKESMATASAIAWLQSDRILQAYLMAVQK